MKVRAGASAGTQAEGVRRGLETGGSGLFGTLGEGGREGNAAAALQVRALSRSPEKLRLLPPGQQQRSWTSPAHPGQDLPRALSEQLTRGGLLMKLLRPQSAPATSRRQRCRAAAPHLPARRGPKQLARTMRPVLLRAGPSGPGALQTSERGSALLGAREQARGSPAPGGPVCSQCTSSSHQALHSPTSGSWAGTTNSGLSGGYSSHLLHSSSG